MTSASRRSASAGVRLRRFSRSVMVADLVGGLGAGGTALAANVMRHMKLSLADPGPPDKRSATDGPVRPIAFALPSSRRSRVLLPESSGMAETALATSYRSHLSGSLRSEDVGAFVRLAGWVHRARDLGGLVFVDLRDRAGIVQVSFDPSITDRKSTRLNSS